MSQPVTTPDLAAIAARLAPGATVSRQWTLKGGISSIMTAFEIDVPGLERPRRLVLREPSEWARKNNPQTALHEQRLMLAMAARGIPAAEPVLMDDAHEQPQWIVVNYVPAEQTRNGFFLTTHAEEAARWLAKIHRTPTAGFEDMPLQSAQIARMIRNVPEKPDEAAEESLIRATLSDLWTPDEDAPPCLLHGDYWPGNILWADDQIAAIVDWEDAARGNPLYDLAVSRLDWLWVTGPRGMADFTESYLKHARGIDARDLPVWDLVAALRPLHDFASWAEGWGEFGRPDVTERAMRRDHKWFVGQAMKALGLRA